MPWLALAAGVKRLQASRINKPGHIADEFAAVSCRISPWRACAITHLALQILVVPNVATAETPGVWSRATRGNGGLSDLGQKSLRRMQFPPTRDSSEPTCAGLVQSAFG